MNHLVLFVSLILTSVLAAPYNVKPGDNLLSVLQNLVAGDVVSIQAGTYTMTSRAGFKLPGTVAQPIIIQGNGSVIIQRTNANNNIWDFSGSNFIIKNLTFTGGSRGLRMGDGGNVSNALFQDIVIHDTADTAWSFNDAGKDYNNITARRVEIYNTGSGTSECIYPGCNDNLCVFRNSLFEYIYCHDTLSALAGYGSGFNLKSGSYNNIIRYSVFWNVRGPGVFFYDSYDLGNNIGYNNLIVNSGDNGIQCTAGCIIENNIVVNSSNCGITGAINQLKAGTSPRNIVIRGNTVVNAGDACLRGNSWGASTITVANNAFFCSKSFAVSADQSAATWLTNGYTSGSTPTGASGFFTLSSVATELTNPTGYNFYPKSTSTLLGKATTNQLPSFDFNCNTRSNTVGAYQYSTTTNPGWSVAKMMRPVCSGSSGTTTGASTTAKATTGASVSTVATSAASTTSDSTTSDSSTTSTTSSTISTSSTTGGEIVAAQVDWTSTAPVYINQSTFSSYVSTIFNTSDFTITSYSCQLVAKRVETWNINSTLEFQTQEAIQKVEIVQNQIANNYTAFVETVSNTTGMGAPKVNVAYSYNDVSAGSLVAVCCYVWIIALLFILV